MSRSYKKHPYCTETQDGRRYNMKRHMNHVFRRFMKMLDDEGAQPKNLSKRITERWDICDYKWRESKEQAAAWWKSQPEGSYWKNKYPTLESYLKEWEKWYKRK